MSQLEGLVVATEEKFAPPVAEVENAQVPAAETEDAQAPAEETKDQPVPDAEPVDSAKVLAELQAKLAELMKQAGKPAPAAKNHVAGRVTSRKYQLLTKELQSWGRVPQQQADLAKLIASSFEVGVEISEADLFEEITNRAWEFDSLRKSVQHPTYLFKYYRGLKDDGKHAGFIARDFLVHD